MNRKYQVWVWARVDGGTWLRASKYDTKKEAVKAVAYFERQGRAATYEEVKASA